MKKRPTFRLTYKFEVFTCRETHGQDLRELADENDEKLSNLIWKAIHDNELSLGVDSPHTTLIKHRPAWNSTEEPEVLTVHQTSVYAHLNLNPMRVYRGFRAIRTVKNLIEQGEWNFGREHFGFFLGSIKGVSYWDNRI